MTATDAATEVVADVAEEVSDQALRVAETSRELSGRGFGLAVGTFFVGAGVGGGLVYIFTRRALETKYSKIADDEISEMREHYQAKSRALEAEAAKRPVEDIVKERGYAASEGESAAPPMAIPPPRVTSESEDDNTEPPPVRNIFKEVPEVNYEWDWHAERRKRSPDIPYVIHYDERHDIEGYSEVTLTYYDGDDVLCNERDEIVDPDTRNELLGTEWMERFGHGSNDPSIVYIRNDPLEIMYEVIKSPHYYAEEVHGFKHEDLIRGNLERMRARERDDNED